MSAVADVLNGAADLIERDGWCQHEWNDKDGRRCIAAAIAEKAGVGAPYERAIRTVAFHPGVDAGLKVIDWNNASGRTQDEVVAALRAAAERAA